MNPLNMTFRVEAHDTVEFVELKNLWDNSLRQMLPGQFYGQTEFVHLNGLIFYREQLNQRIVATGTVPAGYFVFGGSLSADNSVDWCGAAVNPTQIALGLPLSENEIIFPDVTHHVALLVPEHMMLNYFGEELLAEAKSIKPHHLKCQPQRGRELVGRISRLVTRYQANELLLADANECKAAESQLMDDLAGFFLDFNGQSHNTSPSRRRKILHRAIEFSENLREPISVPELAFATGMSQRTLELAFKESLGITPLQYLHRQRMYSAHRDLLASNAEYSLVTKIVARWGFTELGRFAGEYKRIYGESPSATLKRPKVAPTHRLSDAFSGWRPTDPGLAAQSC